MTRMLYTSYLGDEANGGRLFQAENQHIQRLRGEKLFEELKEVHIIVGIRGEECRSKLDPNQKVLTSHVHRVGKGSQKVPLSRGVKSSLYYKKEESGGAPGSPVVKTL